MILFSNCQKRKEYQFNVINLNNAGEIVIELRTNSKTLKINLAEQKNFFLKNKDCISGYTICGNSEIFFYPNLFNLENGGTIEAFVYDRTWVEKDGNVYKISPCQNECEYFLYSIIGGRMVRIISRNPIINIEGSDDLNVDFTYIKDPPEILINEITDKEYKCGYVVRSNIDSSLLLLD